MKQRTAYRLIGSALFLFSFIHSYLWAFGIYEPEHNWFGLVLVSSSVASAVWLASSHNDREP
jgi:hypothetical protein